MKKRHFTPQEEEEIVDYYLTPFSLTETAKHFKTRNPRVKEILDKHDIARHTAEENASAKKEKTKATNQLKYGVVNAFQTTRAKEGREAFYKDKSRVEEAILKSKQTKLNTYGDENYNNAPKMKQTRRKKYGVDNFFQDPAVHKKALEQAKSKESKEKKKRTCLKNFGVEYSLSANSVRKVIEQTCMEKYGIKNPGATEDVRNKVIKTNVTRYGAEWYAQTEECKLRHHRC